MQTVKPIARPWLVDGNVSWTVRDDERLIAGPTLNGCLERLTNARLAAQTARQQAVKVQETSKVGAAVRKACRPGIPEPVAQPWKLENFVRDA